MVSPYKCDKEEKANNLGSCGIPDNTTGVATGCTNCFLQVQNYMNEYYDIDRGCGELYGTCKLLLNLKFRGRSRCEFSHTCDRAILF